MDYNYRNIALTRVDKSMKKFINQQLAGYEELPEHVAEMPERQRKSMQKARRQGLFNGRDHLANSPIGRAMAHGFPVPVR